MVNFNSPYKSPVTFGGFNYTSWNIDCVKVFIADLDPNLSKQSDIYHTGVILCSSLVVPPSITKLSAFTGYKADYISKIAKRLRRNRIWIYGGKVDCAPWFNKSGGSIAFWCDVGVAMGNMQRDYHCDANGQMTLRWAAI